MSILCVTSNELSIYYSYRWIVEIRGTHTWTEIVLWILMFLFYAINFDVSKVLKMSPHFQRWWDIPHFWILGRTLPLFDSLCVQLLIVCVSTIWQFACPLFDSLCVHYLTVCVSTIWQFMCPLFDSLCVHYLIVCVHVHYLIVCVATIWQFVCPLFDSLCVHYLTVCLSTFWQLYVLIYVSNSLCIMTYKVNYILWIIHLNFM